MPQVNSYRPGVGGVMSTAVGRSGGRNFRIPKEGKTTSSEQGDVSWRSKTRRTGLPAGTRTVAGSYPPRTTMRTSAGPAPAPGTATPATACRGATKKYQFTHAITPSPATTTIQSVADIETSVRRAGSYPANEV